MPPTPNFPRYDMDLGCPEKRATQQYVKMYLLQATRIIIFLPPPLIVFISNYLLPEPKSLLLSSWLLCMPARLLYLKDMKYSDAVCKCRPPRGPF